MWEIWLNDIFGLVIAFLWLVFWFYQWLKNRPNINFEISNTSMFIVKDSKYYNFVLDIQNKSNFNVKVKSIYFPLEKICGYQYELPFDVNIAPFDSHAFHIWEKAVWLFVLKLAQILKNNEKFLDKLEDEIWKDILKRDYNLFKNYSVAMKFCFFPAECDIFKFYLKKWQLKIPMVIDTWYNKYKTFLSIQQTDFTYEKPFKVTRVD